MRDSVTVWQCDSDMWRTYDKITSKHQLRQGPRSLTRQTERFSSLLNYNNRAQLNWWSDLNNKRQIIKNIWKIFIDLTSSFLAAHSFSTFQPARPIVSIIRPLYSSCHRRDQCRIWFLSPSLSPSLPQDKDQAHVLCMEVADSVN